jgi:hypothetical protein
MSKFNAGQSFVDGDTVTGAKLNNITGLLDIYTGLISEQTAMVSTVSTADQLLIADTDNGDSGAANRVTVQKLLDDALTNGTYTNANLSGTITSNRTVATSATITTGTIPTLVSNNATIGTTTGTLGNFTSAAITSGTITTALIPTLTAGTTTGTTGIFTSGTVATLNSTNATISSLNSATSTITNLSTTLAGDLTISQGTATASTATVAKLASAQEYTATHNFNATTLTSGASISWNLASNQVTRLVLSTNGTMAEATNKVDGATYILIVTQGTGSNTLGWDATYKWPGATAPTLTTGSAKSDIFTFVSDGTSLFGVASQNYS